ncbi:MAG: co-chaperone GroES [Campylobacterota bacterium]
MSFQPLGDRVLVKRVQEEQKTASGIIIPDNAKEKPQEAVVEEVGPDAEAVSKGDKIVFAKYSGTEMKLDGKDYLILEVGDILGIVR